MPALTPQKKPLHETEPHWTAKYGRWWNPLRDVKGSLSARALTT